MGSVRRNAPGTRKRVARYGFALLLGVANSGCAGLGSFRGSDYPFMGGFWDFGKNSEPVLMERDSYVEQMNAGRAKVADRQAGPAKPADTPAGTKPGDAKDNGEPKKDDAGQDDPKPKLITSQRSRGTGDDAIRVTLGRPESLPAVKPPPLEPPSRTLVASNSTGTARKKQTAPPDDEQIADEATPELSQARVERIPFNPADPPAVEKLPGRPYSESGTRTARNTPRRSSPAKSREVEESDEPQALASASRPGSTRKAPAAKNDEMVAMILEKAKAKLNSLDAYQVSMSRVERVNGKLQPEENVLLSIRRSPQAVRLQWEEGPSKGREVIYSTSVDPKVIHVNMANAAIPLPRMSIAVDSPMVTKNSRHSIKEAGFDTILAHMTQHRDSGDNTGSSGGKVTYKGVVRPEGLDESCHLFVRNAPNGEKWEVLLDEKSLLPRSVVAHDAKGELLERYTYRDIKQNPIELTSADAFDPDSRWGKSRGLFSRLAGGAAGSKNNPSPSTTR